MNRSGRIPVSLLQTDVKMAEAGATELLIYYPYRASTELAENGNKITSTLSVEQEQSRPDDSHHIGKYGFAFAKYGQQSGYAC